MDSHKRYKFKLRYFGKNFSGFQEQPKRVTVQSVFEKALAKVTGENVRVIPCSRTDAGVHALCQFVHANYSLEKSFKRLEKRDFLLKINGVLKNSGISVLESEYAPNFHARQNAKNKTYIYLIQNSRIPDPLVENFMWTVPLPLNIKAMNEAAKTLVGIHDFTSFCAADAAKTSKTRQIFSIKVSQTSVLPLFEHKNAQHIKIIVTGSGFLKQMVRILVGTLVEVGLGKRSPESLKKTLTAKDRKKAGVSAPAQGLYLAEIQYDESL